MIRTCQKTLRRSCSVSAEPARREKPPVLDFDIKRDVKIAQLPEPTTQDTSTWRTNVKRRPHLMGPGMGEEEDY